MPKITKSTTCQILYYEEDYLDCVTHQTVLIDIRENIMKF